MKYIKGDIINETFDKLTSDSRAAALRWLRADTELKRCISRLPNWGKECSCNEIPEMGELPDKDPEYVTIIESDGMTEEYLAQYCLDCGGYKND